MNTDFIINRKISIPVEAGLLCGLLTIPDEPKGLIILIYGNGGNKINYKSGVVIEILNSNGFATCLIDLLTANEDLSCLNEFKREEIVERLIVTTEWLMECADTRGLEIGYYGESSCASETIYAATKLGMSIKAIVSRGCDKEGLLELIGKVSTPVLALAGDGEKSVANPGWRLYSAMEIRNNNINRSAHALFEEHRKLTLVAKISIGWFEKYLNGGGSVNKRLF